MTLSEVVRKLYRALEFIGNLVKMQIPVHKSEVGPENIHF